MLGVAAGSPALAQPLPPSADPGRVDQRLVEPPRPRSTPPLQIEGPEAAPPPAQARAIRFGLTEVRVEGSDRIPEAELAALIAPLAGREVTLLEVYELRDAITARLRGDGFVLSQAIIPAQRVEGGILRIEAIEGFISDVAYEGDVSPAVEALLSAYVARILAERPLRASTLERQMLLMDDLPGVGVRSVLRPNDEVKGGTTLVLVAQRRAFGGSVSLDNRGSRAIGPLQADVTAEARLLEHKLSVRALTAIPTDELMLGDAAWTSAVGALGTTVTVGARKSVSRPGGVARTNGVHSDTRSVRFAVSHPIVRSSAETIRLTAEVGARHSRTQNNFGKPAQRLQSEDRLRVLALTGSWDFADVWGGSNVLQATLNKGFGGLGASNRGVPRSRADGEVDFTKLNLYAQRDQPLGGGLSLTLAAEAQLTRDHLLSSEEYGVGGKSFGLAYDSSEITGETGGAVRAELSWTTRSDNDAMVAQPFVYLDAGGANNRDDGSVGSNRRVGWQTLWSAGIGTRLFVGNVSAGLLLAKPFSDHGAETGRPWRAFFTLSARF
jgi:hemolysin activation/secretion protein